MQQCDQTPGLSIYAHGLDVWKHLEMLLNGDTSTLRLPQWYVAYKDQLLRTAHSRDILKDYAIMHDLSKPYCLTIGEDGKRHFPNHAMLSKQIWMASFPDHPHHQAIGDLIGNDMLMHTESFETIIGLNLSDQMTCSLLLSALAEIHSNANTFYPDQGIQSDWFKIKFKKLEKLGNKLCERMFNHAYMYVITRKDLSTPQQAVQAGHAMIEATRAYLKPNAEHPSIVLCAEKNESKLRKLQDEFILKGIPFKAFHEPDIGNQLTALATAPIAGEGRTAFKKLQLIKEKTA